MKKRPLRKVSGTRDAEASRRALLEAATREFSRRGLEGGRIDRIAADAGVNKQLVYHYFGSKDALYLRVLEEAYFSYRQVDAELELPSLEPVDAVKTLIAGSVARMQEQAHFPTLVIDENFHRARHLKHSAKVRELHARLLETIRQVLKRGEAAGVFRKAIDPLQLYLSIASLSTFYMTNGHTLSAVFGTPFDRIRAIPSITALVERLILGYVLADPSKVEQFMGKRKS